MPGIGGPPTIIKPPDPKDSDGSPWWVYALVGVFLASGVVMAVLVVLGVV